MSLVQVPCTQVAAAASPQEAAPVAEQEYAPDVYASEPQRLETGVRKHTLSVFVADESGLINRVAGVFARRGANIESLAVGLTVDKALFTIVATGTDTQVANLVKQISKLVQVRYVEDITDCQRIEREMVLLKLHCPPGPTRTEVVQIADIFRARVVDVSERTVTLCVTGDSGKMAAFQKVLTKFGIVELVRTGRIALKRGEQVFKDPLWESGNNGLPKPAAHASHAAPAAPAVEPVDTADVYAAGGKGPAPYWNVQNVLDAAYSSTAAEAPYDAFTLNIEVLDKPGVLNQVTGVFARRGYNLQSLAVGNSEREGRSRITTVLPGDTRTIANLIKQLLKLVYVDKVTDLTNTPYIARELMLIKVRCTPAQRGELMNLAQIFHGVVIDVSPHTLTIELTGKEDKMRALQEVLEPYGVLELARTGRIALGRESGVDTRYLSGVAGTRVML
ncbi:hypothetical protein N2152v2_009831 [Parachlorella kessleri]